MEKALIVIDMLNDFMHPEGALYCGGEARHIIRNVLGRINEYRLADLPIIFLTDAHEENDLEFARFPKHCVTKTWGAEFVAEIIPAEKDSIVRKTRHDGFYETALDMVMVPYFNLNPEKSIIEVCGVCTSICVMDTICQLVNRDYTVVIHRNCVADSDQEMHNFSLKRMETLYGATII